MNDRHQCPEKYSVRCLFTYDKAFLFFFVLFSGILQKALSLGLTKWTLKTKPWGISTIIKLSYILRSSIVAFSLLSRCFLAEVAQLKGFSYVFDPVLLGLTL